MFDWLPWKNREAAEAASLLARYEEEKRHCDDLVAEVAAHPYRICERADGLWRVEYAYVGWFWRAPPSVQWKAARHASRLPSRHEALEAVQRLLNPVVVAVDNDGKPVNGGPA